MKTKDVRLKCNAPKIQKYKAGERTAAMMNASPTNVTLHLLRSRIKWREEPLNAACNHHKAIESKKCNPPPFEK